MKLSEDKNKTVQLATLYGRLADRYTVQKQSVDLESHSESVTIKASFILPSDFTGLMEKDRLIWRLRYHVKPSSVILADPALLRHRIARHIFDL